MTRDAAVEITLYDCSNCGATNGPTYHDGGSCEGPVLHIGGEWRCGNCGAQITPSESCFECGARVVPSRLQTPLDLRPAASPRAIEQAIHKRVNRLRGDHSVGTISYSDHLSAIALQHSRDMASRDYFNHDSPDGESAADRYDRFGHTNRSVGENIAFRQPGPTAGADEIAEDVVEGWMDSPGHRENLLRDRFEAEGIGVFCDPDRTVYVTQNFR